jgi:transmembrane sensor
MVFGRSDERVAREADAWVARLRGPATDEDRAALEAWRAADPRHEAAYLRSEAVWRAAGAATRTPERDPTSASPPRAIMAGPRLAIASIVALVAAASAAMLVEQLRPERDGLEIASAAEPKPATLADGSKLLLAPESVVATHFDGATRAVTLLRGRARFTVAHDAAHPFVVTAGDRTVTARGTVFDVTLEQTGISVTMIDGVVDVAPVAAAGPLPEHVVRLERGERLVVAGGAQTVTEVGESATRDYPPTSLAAVLRDANRDSDRPITLADASLGALLVQGRFAIASTDALARQLAAALNLEVHTSSTALVLARPVTVK